MMDTIEIGFHTFVSGAQEEFGAVREVSADQKQLTIYVENAGDFTVSADTILEVHHQKVIFDRNRLDARLQDAIAHAHDEETTARYT